MFVHWPGNPAYREVAAVYLRALALGFRGKFWGFDDGGQLASYRQELFAFIFQHYPTLGSNAHPLFPDAYAHIITAERGTMLPQVWKWIAALVVVAVWCGVASGVWQSITSDIFDAAQTLSHLKENT